MIFEQLQEIIMSQLEIDKKDITMESYLSEDLGASNLDMIDLAMTIEDEFSIEVTDEALGEMKTVEDIVNFLELNT